MNDVADSYFVVINHEEQYSIWAASRPLPAGWTAVGEARSRSDCLDYIDEVWTDMRPKSVREHLARSED